MTYDMTNFNRFDDNIEQIIRSQNRRRVVRELIGSLAVSVMLVAFVWLMFAM